MKYNFNERIDRSENHSAKWAEMEMKFGRSDLIPMWVADMDIKAAPEIVESMKKKVEQEIFGYVYRPDSYYKTATEWLKKRFGYEISPSSLIHSPGVVPSMSILVKMLTKTTDKILIQTPVYPPFASAVKDNGKELVENPLIKDEKGYYTIDFEDLEKKLSLDEVKLFILCNPHNPVGKVWTKEELKTIGDICKKHNVFVVSDEIHMDFVYTPHKHIAFYEVDPEYKNFSIVLTAASKTFNLAALQTSAAIITDEKLRNQFEKVKMSHSISDPTILGFIATTVAYTKGDEWVDQLLDYIKGNMDYLDHFLKTECPGVSLIDPQGLYLAWVDLRTLGMSNEELEDFMLHKAHLWLDEGYVFGEEGSGFERFNLACPRSTLEKACLQLKKALDERSA